MRAILAGLPLRLLLYTAAAVLATWPVAAHPRSLLIGTGGPGDPLLNLWILGWDLSTLQADPLRFFDGRVFDANIFFPAAGTLTYSDHLLPQALVMWPVYWLTRDPVLCFNLLFLGSMVASGGVMDRYVERLSGSRLAAGFAGLAWTIAPWRFAHVIHIQLQGLYVLPLTFLALHQFIDRRRRRDALLLGLALAWQLWTSVYLGLIGGIGAAVGAVALAAAGPRRVDGLVIRRFVLAVVAALVLAAPMIFVYARVQQLEGFGRTLHNAASGSARLESYLRAPAINRFYGDEGRVPLTRPNARAGAPASPERQLFGGVVVLVLAVVGGVSAWRHQKVGAVAVLTAVGLTGFVLSFGPGVGPIYTTLYRIVYGLEAIRAPARFAVLVAFALAGFAGFGFAAIVRAVDRRSRQMTWGGVSSVVIGALLLGAALGESLNRTDAYLPAPPRTTALGQWLKRAPEPGAVVFLPPPLDVANTPLMVQSLEHLRPLVNGYSGQMPAFHEAVLGSLSAFPASEALWLLHDLDVRFVVTPQPAAPPSDLPPTAWPLVERTRLDGMFVYELRWNPETDALLAPPAAKRPPPGPAPFADGERLVYSIHWTGAPVRAEAGRATVSVREHRGGETAYTFAADAATAPWLARIFEGTYHFQTTATADLLPVVHERQMREGKRSLDRRYEYEPMQRVVKVDGRQLPLTPGALDALTAFFYLRTLPWTDGSALDIPLNDAGQSATLRVRSRGRSTVVVHGTERPALRLDCVIEAHFAGRPPIRLTAWLHDDAQRALLAADVDIVLGRVRVELVDP